MSFNKIQRYFIVREAANPREARIVLAEGKAKPSFARIVIFLRRRRRKKRGRIVNVIITCSIGFIKQMNGTIRRYYVFPWPALFAQASRVGL
jgi:hypothetical protein